MEKKGVRRVLILAIAAIASLGLTTAALAWTGEATGFYYFDTVYGNFNMAAVDYWENNNSSTVDLDYASLHIKFPDSCCVGVQEAIVYEDGPGHYDVDNVSVDEDEYEIVPLELGTDTYSKGAGSVVVENRTGMLGTCNFGDCGMWWIVWEDDGEIWEDHDH